MAVLADADASSVVEPDDVLQLLRAALAEFIGSFLVVFCSCAAVISNSHIFEVACAVSLLRRPRDSLHPRWTSVVWRAAVWARCHHLVLLTEKNIRRSLEPHRVVGSLLDETHGPTRDARLYRVPNVRFHRRLLRARMCGPAACLVPPFVYARSRLAPAVATHGATGLDSGYAASSLGVNILGDNVTPLQAVGIEAIASFLLVFAYLSTTADVHPSPIRPPARPPLTPIPPLRALTHLHFSRGPAHGRTCASAQRPSAAARAPHPCAHEPALRSVRCVQPGLSHVWPLPVGFAVVAGVLAAGNLSGGSMGLARSLGPAIASGQWDHNWVYSLGSFVGGTVAGIQPSGAPREYARAARSL